LVAGGANGGYPLYKDGFLDPLLPELILPEVKDEAAWGGWDEAFVDLPHKYVFSMSAFVVSPFYNAVDVSPEQVARTGLKAMLDPAYKGKIAWHDPSIAGGGQAGSLVLRAHLGEEGLRKLIVDQKTIFDRNQQKIVESMARGIASFTIGPPVRSLIKPYVEAGAAVKHDIRLFGNQPDRSYISIGGNTLYVLNRRPHPNAARVFINWILGKDVQHRLALALDQGSRRHDIAATVPPEEARIKGAKYLAPQREESSGALHEAVAVIEQLRKSTR
jgi:iron(III) transport system substrate-binding protein